MVTALPEAFRDYVIIHELAHLREPRHSRNFWELVGTYHPSYRKAENELRKYWLLLECNGVWKTLREV